MDGLWRRIRLRGRPLAAPLVLLLVLLIVLRVSRRPDGLSDLLSSKIPLTLKLRNLNPQWRCFSVGSPFTPEGSPYVPGSLMTACAANLYFTRGRTVEAGGEQYLVAYRISKVMCAESVVMGSGASNSSDVQSPAKIIPEIPLSLSLLNLRAATSLNCVQPFNLEGEIAAATADARLAAQARQQATATSSLNNLKQLAVGLGMYIQDNDERFPPMQDPDTVRSQLNPYIKNSEVFIQPGTGAPYAANRSLSLKSMFQITRPADTAAFWEEKPGADGQRGASFVDGQVRRVPQTEWPATLRASTLPPSSAPKLRPTLRAAPR